MGSRSFVLVVVAVVALLALRIGTSGGPDAVAAARHPASNATPAGALPARIERPALRDASSDPFAAPPAAPPSAPGASARTVPLAPLAPITEQPVPAPPALQLLGSARVDHAQPVVLAALGKEVVALQPGLVLPGGWRVEQVGATAVRLVGPDGADAHLPLPPRSRFEVR